MPPDAKVQGAKARSSEARLLSHPVKNSADGGIYYC